MSGSVESPVEVVASRLGVETALVQSAVDSYWAGWRPGAVKRGRNRRWPYVPILIRPSGGTRQVLGLAYATRAEALAAADRHLDSLRDSTVASLGERGCRALRVSLGLPREVTP